MKTKTKTENPDRVIQFEKVADEWQQLETLNLPCTTTIYVEVGSSQGLLTIVVVNNFVQHIIYDNERNLPCYIIVVRLFEGFNDIRHEQILIIVDEVVLKLDTVIVLNVVVQCQIEDYKGNLLRNLVQVWIAEAHDRRRHINIVEVVGKVDIVIVLVGVVIDVVVMEELGRVFLRVRHRGW